MSPRSDTHRRDGPGPIDRWMSGANRIPLLTPAQELLLAQRIRAWQAHPDGPDKAPEKIRRAGLKARDRMVSSNLRLVGSVVLKSRTRLAFEDAAQSATIGLQRAAELFDPARGYKFSTYAYWWIRQAINRADEDMGATIRIPNHLQQKLVRMDRAAADLHQRQGRPPSRAELAEAIGVPLDTLDLMRSRGRYCASLDTPVGDSACRLCDLIAADGDAWEGIETGFTLERLRVALDQLRLVDPKAVTLLSDHYGLSGQEPACLAAVGRRHGVTREAVRQTRNKLLARLRHMLNHQELQERGELPGV